MLQRVSILVLAAMLMAMFVGCNSAAPTVDVTHVRIIDQTEQGGRVMLQVELINPNNYPLPMPTANYTVTIDGAGTFEFDGVVPLAVMPWQGTQTLDFPAAFSTRAPLVGRSYTAKGSIRYNPPGELRAFLTESGFPLPHIGFNTSGVVE